MKCKVQINVKKYKQICFLMLLVISLKRRPVAHHETKYIPFYRNTFRFVNQYIFIFYNIQTHPLSDIIDT